MVTELCDRGSLMDALAARSFPRLLRPPGGGGVSGAGEQQLGSTSGWQQQQQQLQQPRLYDMHVSTVVVE